MGLTRENEPYQAKDIPDSYFYTAEIPVFISFQNAHTKLKIKALDKDSDCAAIVDVLNQNPAVIASGQPISADACVPHSTSECIAARQALSSELKTMIEALDNADIPADYAEVVDGIVDNGKLPDDVHGM